MPAQGGRKRQPASTIPAWRACRAWWGLISQPRRLFGFRTTSRPGPRPVPSFGERVPCLTARKMGSTGDDQRRVSVRKELNGKDPYHSQATVDDAEAQDAPRHAFMCKV